MEFDYLNQLLDSDDFEDIFKEFDFSLLNNKDFKEDAVREEIVFPILKMLGYSASGKNKIIRSKSLKHPFYYFGTKKYNVNIIPDYTFQIEDKNLWILDAKRPNENIAEGKNVFQAYSYAMHPEIQAEIYALCNGKEFVIFNTRIHTPIFSFEISNLKENWNELKRHLLPEFVSKPHLKEFSLDLGLFLLKIGDKELLTKPITFEVKDINHLAKLDEYTYTLNDVFGIIGFDNKRFVGTFDFNQERYEELLSLIPDRIRQTISSELSNQPFRYKRLEPEGTPLKIISHVGSEILTNDNESYMPFNVIKFEKNES